MSSGVHRGSKATSQGVPPLGLSPSPVPCPVPGNPASMGLPPSEQAEQAASPGSVLTSLAPPDGSRLGAKRWGRCQHPWERHTFFPRQNQAERGDGGEALKLCWEEACL